MITWVPTFIDFVQKLEHDFTLMLSNNFLHTEARRMQIISANLESSARLTAVQMIDFVSSKVRSATRGMTKKAMDFFVHPACQIGFSVLHVLDPVRGPFAARAILQAMRSLLPDNANVSTAVAAATGAASVTSSDTVYTADAFVGTGMSLLGFQQEIEDNFKKNKHDDDLEKVP